jgi:hypothetical protein
MRGGRAQPGPPRPPPSGFNQPLCVAIGSKAQLRPTFSVTDVHWPSGMNTEQWLPCAISVSLSGRKRQHTCKVEGNARRHGGSLIHDWHNMQSTGDSHESRLSCSCGHHQEQATQKNNFSIEDVQVAQSVEKEMGLPCRVCKTVPGLLAPATAASAQDQPPIRSARLTRTPLTPESTPAYGTPHTVDSSQQPTATE